jgi:hypothetical protein
VRRTGLLLAALLLLGGCGESEAPGAASPREAFELFVTAVNERDPDASGLVTRSLDEETRGSFVDAARQDLEPLRRGYRIIFDDTVGESTAVVAAQGDDHPGPGAAALTLVREDERWLVQPGTLDVIYGTSATGGTSAARPVVDFQVNAPSGDVTARMWIDTNEVRLRKQGDGRYVAGIKRLMPRLYSVVAYAKSGDRAGTIAWTFTAR